MTLTWVFVRGDERLELRRESDPESTSLEVSGPAGQRAFNSRDRAALIAFHAGFEQALTQSGWRFEAFYPERRGGQDRRSVPRASERRGALELVWSR
jgi:hypothetical protein